MYNGFTKGHKTFSYYSGKVEVGLAETNTAQFLVLIKVTSPSYETRREHFPEMLQQEVFLNRQNQVAKPLRDQNSETGGSDRRGLPTEQGCMLAVFLMVKVWVDTLI